MWPRTRRQILSTFSFAAAAGSASTGGARADADALETTSLRFVKFPGICVAPQYIAGELLRAEGFTGVQYVDLGPTLDLTGKVARGDADFTLDFAARAIQSFDDGGAVVALGGVHVGCQELFAKDDIHTIGDLRGRTIGVQVIAAKPQAFLIAMAAHVGFDPLQDIRWVSSTNPSIKPMELFLHGKIDAFLATPPEPLILRARGINHVIFNSALDPPWSQYYCCVLVANRQFVRDKPVATRRVLRAILKAADLCAGQPALVARQLVEQSFIDNYDIALRTLRDVPYDRWREYDPEDTIRYYALRLHEAHAIRSTPQKIIAEHTDWRFLNEVKRELKT
jgi:NitT/TauT family transport system substrate-binding protein